MGVADRVGNLRFHTQLYKNIEEHHYPGPRKQNLAPNIKKYAQQSMLLSKHEQQP